MYKIVFMGTPDFAVESLDALYKAGHEIALVVSQQDKPSGRNLQLKPTPVKEYAISHGLKIAQPEKIKKNNDFFDILRQIAPDIIVVVAYGKILPQELIDIPKKGVINVHGSLLPKYRGAAPIQWAVINGEKETGITTMFVDKGMDTGDMLLKESIKIDENDTYGIVYEKLKNIGGKLLIKTIENLDNIVPQKQDDNFLIAPMIEKSLGKIDFNKSAKDIHNLVRGLNPMPGAYFELEGHIFKVWETEIIDNDDSIVPGTVVISNSKQGLYIKTGENMISIKIIQAENSKRLNILDYLRGNRIEEGIVL